MGRAKSAAPSLVAAGDQGRAFWEQKAMSRIFFENVLLPDGWVKDVAFEVDPEGWIREVQPGSTRPAEGAAGTIALPGLPNLHSHAFQRGMAGLAETKGSSDDSFWTWRQVMYRFLERLTPEDVQAIASQLYIEMLEAGFTAVGEFHYLHHGPDGMPYDDLGAMAGSIAAAAEQSGIGVTFLPVFYAQGGFDGQPVADAQRRFYNDPERFAKLLERIRDIAGSLPDAALGMAPHSLRAVTPENLAKALAACPAGPLHIHIAEQTKEVDDCLAWCGQRPVQWLLDHQAVNDRWCLVHATHMEARECEALAASGAVAGLCPITEANLGDGIFDAQRYLAKGGAYGVGSDSHVFVSAAEELRLLEYSQRLSARGRNLLSTPGVSTGRSLFDAALAGGAQALGRRNGALEVGRRADIITLDAENPALFGKTGDAWLDAWIFAGDNSLIRNVWVGGHQVVSDGRHIARQKVTAAYRTSLTRILQD
jgi:formiminoglutamate deiminase